MNHSSDSTATLMAPDADLSTSPKQALRSALVTGASGLVGQALCQHLGTAGIEVHTLGRGPARGERAHSWDPTSGQLALTDLEGMDAVVHLAGESIAEGRWTEAKMARIRDSRVVGTRLLCERLAQLETKPRVLVCASAIGFYGDRGDELLHEGSTPGKGFLVDVCQEWEDACAPAREAGIRVVSVRIGVVLSRKGGALAKMLLPFQLGVGGNIGDGRQYMSWIELGDLVSVIQHAIECESLSGPVNAVAPVAATNAEYTRALGRALGRPTIFPVPAFAARLAFGKMAEDLLLASVRVEPRALLSSGFQFRHGELDDALRAALKKS
jgi:uncharacterized protein (TIGR01777 family)